MLYDAKKKEREGETYRSCFMCNKRALSIVVGVVEGVD